MGLETATLIHELDPANPVGASDPKSQGDNHIRLLKSTILNTFQNVDGAVTASHTEINKLAGLTAATAELNKLTGLTATTAELNKLAGATPTTAEINKLAGLAAITAELNKLAGTPAGLTATEIGFLDGVTSAIQTQLNAITAIIAGASSGTYTPVISGTVNVAANTPLVCQWMRFNNIALVSGEITVQPGSNGFTAMDISLPVASNLASSNQLAGGGAYNAGTLHNPAWVHGDATNNTANVFFVATNTANAALSFMFMYSVV